MTLRLLSHTAILSTIVMTSAFSAHKVFAQFHEKPLTITVGSHTETIPIDVLKDWQVVQPYLAIDQTKLSQGENYSFCPSHRRPCFLRVTTRERSHITIKKQFFYDTIKIGTFLEILSKDLDIDPVNASLGVRDDKVIVLTPHQNGMVIDADNAIKDLTDALKTDKSHIKLPFAKRFATVRADNLKELGLIELIGEGRSDFHGSTPSRIHNIRTASSKFNNLLIAPGETFSFVKNLGAVDGTTGYKKELVIRDHKTIAEYGGGICQVSTTVFRGAILTGMKIIERRNHSYPVKYYAPMGFDATIYLPAPDMKFQNNTSHHILLNTTIEGTELVFRYYGTKDGRTVIMNGPHVTERGHDGSAKTYFTQKVTDANGTLIIDDYFSSVYKSPKAYPKVGDTSIGKITAKPSDWSKKQWKSYKKTSGL